MPKTNFLSLRLRIHHPPAPLQHPPLLMSCLLEESHIFPQSTSQLNAPNGPLPSPIPSFQLRRLVCDTPTELLVQTFDDRIFVVITQNGKVGCLVRSGTRSEARREFDTTWGAVAAVAAITAAAAAAPLTLLLALPDPSGFSEIYQDTSLTLLVSDTSVPTSLRPPPTSPLRPHIEPLVLLDFHPLLDPTTAPRSRSDSSPRLTPLAGIT
ncbi:hypothetical protein EHS25_009288 [Saitozyma podzolica]|uniref:Uncharacterized protein n=1 Tax=Saitozyma podzolica TaxID=1890683 RepID=A0A427YLC0_9TREE|nr:hypothetical protein EHS25_009288 [Saitozyma podzolica]